MTVKKRAPVRFSLLTILIWLLVAAGIIFLLWQVINRISAGSLPVSTTAPNKTQIYQTIAVMLTEQQITPATNTARPGTASPTSQLTLTPATPIPPLQSPETPGDSSQTNTPVVLCNQASAGNPIDITIPDDSLMSPGESFIKTWKLVNSGTCTWTTSYSASFFYGDKMQAPKSVPLQAAVKPDQSVEISVDMIAPLTPGTYQGNWMLSNADGVLFGIGPNGDSPFWVRIIVSENPAATPTFTEETTPASTDSADTTPTPQGQAGGEIEPMPGDHIDLDTITLNRGDEDLVYQLDSNHYHWLAPQQAGKIGVFGSGLPSRSDCQFASMSTAPIAVESLSAGTYLCYTTNHGRLGRAYLKGIDQADFTLTLDLLTWALE